MFILTTISDLIQIPPHEFHRADLEEITDKINEKYSNKVIQNIGLGIALYDLLTASDGLISYGTGNVNVNGELGFGGFCATGDLWFLLLRFVLEGVRALGHEWRARRCIKQAVHHSFHPARLPLHTPSLFSLLQAPPSPSPPPLTPHSVTFRLLIFRPSKSSIILARIASQTALGIHLSTEFFDDIFVPATLLFPNSVFESNEGVWVWHNRSTLEIEDGEAEAENGEEDKLYFDNGNTVRVRVEAEFWTDQAPDGKGKDAKVGGDVEKRRVPWRIEGSMAEPGLGDVMWW